MSRRVTIVSDEVRGIGLSGGSGTMPTNLALALGHGLDGHEVEILYAGSLEHGALDPHWRSAYEAAGVTIRPLVAHGKVVPDHLAQTHGVLRSLVDDPPDIVIANDAAASVYAPLRLRETGADFAQTAFVVRGAGPMGWLAEVSGKVPADSAKRFAVDLTERSCVALADVFVSPSSFLLSWMQARGWTMPEATLVIPNFVQSAATGSGPPPPAATGQPVRRLAFFGHLREGKGVRVFIDAVNGLDPSDLRGRELLFLGGETSRWNERTIRAALHPQVEQELAQLRFEATLDQHAAIELLRQPGALAVMPYLLDNWPHAVAECIEHGIPFIASNTGGTPELVSPDDRDRVLVEPVPDAIRASLSRILGAPEGQLPGGFSRDPRDDVAAWLELIAGLTPRSRRPSRRPGSVALIASADAWIPPAPAGPTAYVVRAASRSEGLERAHADWVMFIDSDVALDGTAIEVLLDAQVSSGADVVTCGVRGQDEAGTAVTCLFLGDPGVLGLVENHYGRVALIRRSLLDLHPGLLITARGPDPDWPLLAGLALGGARIVSIPEALAAYETVHVGTVGDVPGDGLTVLRLFEADERKVRLDAPRLIAALASRQEADRRQATQQPRPTPLRRLAQRARRPGRPS